MWTSEAAGPEQLKRLLSGCYCHQSAGSSSKDKSHGFQCWSGLESRVLRTLSPLVHCEGLPASCLSLDTALSIWTSPQDKATFTRVPSPHLPLVLITPAQRCHSVSYRLAGHQSLTLAGVSNVSRLRTKGTSAPHYCDTSARCPGASSPRRHFSIRFPRDASFFLPKFPLFFFFLLKSSKWRVIQPLPATVAPHSICSTALVQHGALGTHYHHRHPEDKLCSLFSLLFHPLLPPLFLGANDKQMLHQWKGLGESIVHTL